MRPPPGPYRVGIHDARLPDAAGGQRVRLFYPVTPESAEGSAPRWMPPSPSGQIVDETAVGFARYVLPGPIARICAVGIVFFKLE